MKINFVYDNAKEILRKSYDDDLSLLPTIIKCSFHDGIMQSLNTSGLLQQMVFHGGTSLQRIHGSARLSEDLDFCMRNDISDLAVFKTFYKDFKTVLKENFSKTYGIDESDIFFRDPGKDTSIVQDGDVFTGKIGIAVPLGEKRQVINIELENREPLTAEIQSFGRLLNDAFQHDDIYLNVETKEEMLVNKFVSLFQRDRLQYSDFYDIGFLSRLTGNAIDTTLLFEKIRRKFSEDQFIDKLHDRRDIFDDMNTFSSAFRNELKRFIPKRLIRSSLSDLMIEYTKNKIVHYANIYRNQWMNNSALEGGILPEMK